MTMMANDETTPTAKFCVNTMAANNIVCQNKNVQSKFMVAKDKASPCLSASEDWVVTFTPQNTCSPQSL